MPDRPAAQRLDTLETIPDVKAPGSSRSWTLLGLLMLAVAVGGFGVWATTVPLDSAILAAGKVTVASKRKVVQHLEGGIIRMFAVRDGDHVQEGDILIEFDSTRARTRLAITRTAYFSALAAEARLLAERDGADRILFPDDINAEAGADREVAEIAAAQRQILQTRRQEKAGQTSTLESRIARVGEEIRGYAAERAAAELQLGMAREELGTLEDLFRRQHTTRTRVLAARRDVFQLEGALGRLASQIAAAGKEIDETRLNIAQIENRIATEVAADLRNTQARLLEAREQYVASQREVERTLLRAPASGTAFASQVHTIGSVARPGETLLEIVPDHDELLVEVRLRPQDVDNVAVGQPTEVRFSAFKQRTTPTLAGRVSFVSADTFADPRQPEPYYVANVQVTHGELRKLGGLRLQPGMPSDVMIKTGRRTAMAYLMQPFTDSFNRAWREQ